MKIIDRILIAIAVWSVTTGAADGAANLMAWLGAGEGVSALAALAMLVLAPFAVCDALREYRRHGWRSDR